MIVAYRGGEEITQIEDLRAYLGRLLRLENIGILLGAGASTSAGGRTMAQLWERFLENYPQDVDWLYENQFITAHEAKRHEAEELADDPEIEDRVGEIEYEIPNVERLLDTLGIALAEWQRVGAPQLKLGTQAKTSLFKEVIDAAKLNEKWWETHGVLPEQPELKHHRTILQKLSGSRQPGQAAPWVFTTNYDLSVEWAAESIDMSVINGFLGVHNRIFSPQSFDLGFRNRLAQGEARFGVYNIYLAKLHGSLTWKTLSDGNLTELAANHAWSEINSFIRGESDDLGFMVLPSAAKYMQTNGYVLGELFRRFAEYLNQPQTSLLISGYSFGDEHINRLLRSALQNPTLQLVIYYPEFQRPEQRDLPKTLKRLLATQNPRVTIVGGGEEAFLNALAQHLPEPALFDETLLSMRKALIDLSKEPDGGES